MSLIQSSPSLYLLPDSLGIHKDVDLFLLTIEKYHLQLHRYSNIVYDVYYFLILNNMYTSTKGIAASINAGNLSSIDESASSRPRNNVMAAGIKPNTINL
jgi:hypothetical protein